MEAILGMEEAEREQTFLGELAGKLWRRKLLVASIGILLFGVLAVGVQFLPKHYSATASVSVEPPPRAVASTGNVVQDVPFDSETIGTELALLQSQQLLTEAMLKTGLLKEPEFDPDLKASWLAALGRWIPANWLPSDVPPDSTMAERQLSDTLRTLREHVVFAPVPRSRVIDITVSSENNELAAKIANTIATLYIGNHLTYRQDMNSQAHTFVERRMQQLKSEAVVAANAAVNFQISNGLTDTSGNENSTIIQEQAAAVNTQLETARNQLTTLTALYDSDRRANPETLAAALRSETIARLREQQAVELAARARFAATYGPHSPVLIPYNQRVAAIDGQIRAEAEREVGAIPNQIASAKQAVNNLSQRLTVLQTQMAGLDKARAELSMLRVEIHGAQQHLSGIPAAGHADGGFGAVPGRPRAHRVAGCGFHAAGLSQQQADDPRGRHRGFPDGRLHRSADGTWQGHGVDHRGREHAGHSRSGYAAVPHTEDGGDVSGRHRGYSQSSAL